MSIRAVESISSGTSFYSVDIHTMVRGQPVKNIEKRKML